MKKVAEKNLARIRIVAEHLAPLLDKVAFVGGAVVALHITDEAAHDVRPTVDVDLIVEISSRTEYYRLEEQLR